MFFMFSPSSSSSSFFISFFSFFSCSSQGTILRMMDEAGFLAATRFANQGVPESDTLVAALARMEDCKFLEPMRIGDLSSIRAEV